MKRDKGGLFSDGSFIYSGLNEQAEIHDVWHLPLQLFLRSKKSLTQVA